MPNEAEGTLLNIRVENGRVLFWDVKFWQKNKN